MKFGAALPACVEGLGHPLGFVSPGVLARIAEHAEAVGFHAVMANDHISTPNTRPEHRDVRLDPPFLP